MHSPLTASQNPTPSAFQNTLGLQSLAASPAAAQRIARVQEVPLPTHLDDTALSRLPEHTFGDDDTAGCCATMAFHCVGATLLCSGVSAPVVATVTGSWLASNAAHAGGWAALTSPAIVPPLATGLGIWAGMTFGLGAALGCCNALCMNPDD